MYFPIHDRISPLRCTFVVWFPVSGAVFTLPNRSGFKFCALRRTFMQWSPVPGAIFTLSIQRREILFPTASAERSSESGIDGSTNDSETSSLIPLFYTRLLSVHVGRFAQAPGLNCSRRIVTTDGLIGPYDVRYTIEIRIPAITRWLIHLAAISARVVSYDRPCYPPPTSCQVGDLDRAFRYRLSSGCRTRRRFDAELVLCPNKISSPIRCLAPPFVLI